MLRDPNYAARWCAHLATNDCPEVPQYASTTRNDERPPAASDEEIAAEVEIHERLEAAKADADIARTRTLEQTARLMREGRPLTAHGVLRTIRALGIEIRQPSPAEQRAFQRGLDRADRESTR